MKDLSEIRGLFPAKCNVREMGGYPAAGGKSIRHGIFYRSGNLEELGAEPYAGRLQALGLRTILDLRSDYESGKHPDPQIPGAEHVSICALVDEKGEEMSFSPSDIARIAAELKAQGKGPEGFLEIMYGNMAYHNPAFQFLMKELQAQRVPILFHCAAGKDRTGVAGMLIMLLLGCSEEDALDNYELTNAYRNEIVEALLKEHAEEVQKDPTAEKRYRTMEGVDREIGAWTLRGIRERYGSYENYFLQEFGLDTEEIARLRAIYTI